LTNTIDLDLPDLQGRCLITYEKVSKTPVAYPRRPGTPQKYPIER
jgi:hypothetical protein